MFVKYSIAFSSLVLFCFFYLRMFVCCFGVKLDLLKGCFMGYKIKRPADLSIVKRLGRFYCLQKYYNSLK